MKGAVRIEGQGRKWGRGLRKILMEKEGGVYKKLLEYKYEGGV